ncbi:hypothetical protein ABTX81_34520 [Kitasatospora sp. NPDC097605]|uniref:hypothetical protein n=1 Tax=Kitasatospora sp. NPDC097605 TaxID=3157226 RepID=UPI00332BA31A
MNGARPTARRLTGGLPALCAVLTAVAVGWTVDRGARMTGLRETDTDRAERPAGLHHRRHPGKGRYYVPEAAVLTGPRGGPRVAYLHYRIVGGPDSNLDDFVRVYDLPDPGAPAPLPPDLVEALPGEEPTPGAPLPEPPGGRERQIFALDATTGHPGAADVYVRAAG